MGKFHKCLTLTNASGAPAVTPLAWLSATLVVHGSKLQSKKACVACFRGEITL